MVLYPEVILHCSGLNFYPLWFLAFLNCPQCPTCLGKIRQCCRESSWINEVLMYIVVVRILLVHLNGSDIITKFILEECCPPYRSKLLIGTIVVSFPCVVPYLITFFCIFQNYTLFDVNLLVAPVVPTGNFNLGKRGHQLMLENIMNNLSFAITVFDWSFFSNKISRIKLNLWILGVRFLFGIWWCVLSVDYIINLHISTHTTIYMVRCILGGQFTWCNISHIWILRTIKLFLSSKCLTMYN